jgi:hypothetical protein
MLNWISSRITSNLSSERKFIMSKSLKLYRVFGLVVLLFVLQACSCYGIGLNRYFGGTANQSNSSNETVASGMNCSTIRLTSPRSGLPNGVVTVYWDALAGAVSYRINLYSGSVRIGTWEAAPPATNLQADVSQAAVGGNNPFALELLAYDTYGNYCRDYVVQNREAAPPQAPVNAVPSATPTCDEEPSASYC